MDLKEKVRVIEGFPKEGISYKDITTLIMDKDAFRECIDKLYEIAPKDVDKVVSTEARGFIFGSVLAYKLGAGFVPVRKEGKLPSKAISYSYTLEYGSDTVYMHEDAIKDGDRVLLVDDLIATGGTFEAMGELTKKLGGEIIGTLAVIELTSLEAYKNVKDLKSIIKYEI